MSSYAFASLAHVRVLLIPVGSIPKDVFDAHVAEVRAFDSIRLGDIPGDAKAERARFMPSPLSTGYLHLSFTSHPSSPAHDPLYLFRPSLFHHAVIGFATPSASNTPEAVLEQFENILIDISSNSTCPLAKVCFVFQNEDSASGNLGEIPRRVVLIPSVMGNKKLYIGTLLADLCSQVLGEFGRVVHILETPAGNDSLNATLFPTLPASIDLSIDSHPYLGAHAPHSLHSSQSELSTAANHGSMRNSPAPSSTSLHRSATLGPPTVKKRSSGVGTNSSHARLYKVYGDFFLLAGRTQDAKLWYQEALNLFKTGSDPVWQASAIEGMAVLSVLDLWASGQGLQSSLSDVKEPWMEIYDQLSQVIALYLKSASPLETAQDYSLLAFVYTTAVLRQTSLLFCVWSSKGWGVLAFASMLQPGSTSYLQKNISDDSLINLERLSAMTGISRSHIANTLSQAHGPWLLHLSPRERLVILQSMASIYNCLGFRRKEVYVLREVISCVMDLIVCGREEDEQLRRSDFGGAGLAIRTGSANSDELVNSAGSLGVRRNEKLEGNQSILRLVYYICKVLGVNLEAVSPVYASAGDGSEAVDPVAGAEPQPDDTDVTEYLNIPFGWPELQVGVIREAIAVAEALPDYLAVARISLSALKTMHAVLATSDQYHLYQTASRALNVLKRRGETTTVEWWAGRPSISIALQPLPSHRLLIEKPISLLVTSTPPANPIIAGAIDPFLYNPRKSMNARSKCILVQGEVAELVITLRNPFVFDLELQNVSLIMSGVRFECNSTLPLPVVIRPNSFCNVTVSGIAKESGILDIKGCTVQAPNGAPRQVLLPISAETEEDHQSRRQSMMKGEGERTKYSGLESLLWEKRGKRFSAVPQGLKSRPRYMQCVVVPQQPLLRVRWTSLTHGALMLYDGEKSTIRLTLENVSALPIDFLKLSFEDSTISPAQEALSDGELDILEAYETEYDLIHRKVFSWNPDKEFKPINAGRKIVLSVACLGKVGCTSGAFYISYAHVHREKKDPVDFTSETFYTRQLMYPVTVTVYHILECYNMNLISVCALDSLPTGHPERSVTPAEIDDLRLWCLFSIEVRNTYGLPFEVTFTRLQDDTVHVTKSSVIPPGSTSRIILPIKRFRLSENLISRPVPTLSERQFVVGKSSLNKTEEITQRELFWYREELLKIIHAQWKEASGSRFGDLSFRQQRMTVDMLNTLKTDLIRVDLSFAREETEDGSPLLLERRGRKFLTRANTLNKLQVQVTNTNSSALIIMINLSLSPEDHVLFEGTLTDIPLGRIDSGKSKNVDVPLCFLCAGQFEVSAEARKVGVGENIGGQTPVGWTRAIVISTE